MPLFLSDLFDILHNSFVPVLHVFCFDFESLQFCVVHDFIVNSVEHKQLFSIDCKQ